MAQEDERPSSGLFLLELDPGDPGELRHAHPMGHIRLDRYRFRARGLAGTGHIFEHVAAPAGYLVLAPARADARVACRPKPLERR